MRLRSVQRSVQRGPVHGLFGRETFPGGAILHWDADIDAFSEQTGGPHTFNHAVLSPQYQRNADGSYSNVGAKPAVDVFDGEKWLRSCGAITNLLPSGAEDISGLAWNKNNMVAPALVNGRWKLVSANGVNGQAYRSIAPSGAGTYNFSVAAKAGEFRYLRISIGIGFIAPRVSTLYVDLLNGVVATGVETGSAIVSIAPGADGEWIISFPCTYSGSEDSTIYLFPRNVVNDSIISGDGVSGVYVRNPQITATAYPVPYVPPGVTQPASNATTTNGSWFANPDGSPLWHALDGGPETDGVELVTNGGFDEGFTNWTIQLVGNQSIALEPNGARLVFDGSADAGNASQSAMLPIGEYIVEFDVSEGSTGAFKILPFGSSGEIAIFMNTWAGKRYSAKMSITASNVFRVSRVVGQTCNARIDNISIQRIQPQPLTLATRVRMGVGSGYWYTGDYQSYISCRGLYYDTLSFRPTTNNVIVRSSDGTNSPFIMTGWAANTIVRVVVQVNTVGTQFRVGYMIEGTHTAIQWGSWTAFDGSFNPSTLYRLMLGYNNPYPMWFNKVTAWRKQATDAEILEAMA